MTFFRNITPTSPCGRAVVAALTNAEVTSNMTILALAGIEPTLIYS